MDGDNLTGFTLENASRHPAARQFGSSAVRQFGRVDVRSIVITP